MTDAWVRLLCHIKTVAPRKGFIRYRDESDLAYDLRVHKDDEWGVGEMVRLALEDGAIFIKDGALHVANWSSYQFQGAKRTDSDTEKSSSTTSNQTERAHRQPDELDQREPVSPASNHLEAPRTELTHAERLSSDVNGIQHPGSNVTKDNDDRKDSSDSRDSKDSANTSLRSASARGVESESQLDLSVPWWDDPDAFRDDPLACEIARLVRTAKRYETDRPDRAEVARLVEKVREFAPDDSAILDVIAGEGGFIARAAKKSKREYVNPIGALSKWFSMREDNWRRIKRQREIDADRERKRLGRGPAGIADDAFGEAA